MSSNEAKTPLTNVSSPALPAPERKWFWSDSPHSLLFRMPEEVETWHPSVAYPVNQPAGIFTRILWPYNALYTTERDALIAALVAQQKHVTLAMTRLNRIQRAIARIDETAQEMGTTTES